jgi:P83/100 protein
MRRTLGLVMLFLPLFLFAQDVAEDELRELGTADIEFINYDGPHDRIDTDEEIRAIGRALAAGLAGGATEYVYSGKYTVIHAVDPSVAQGLDADIIIPLAGARVDHIDNVRRIISGFLEDSYGYSRADADVLARFATIYNAVSRGNMDFFEDRYKQVVVQHLTSANAGLSRRYDEWPGKSRIVIPLSGEGGLGTVDPGELGDAQVVEELRSQEDMGVEDRQELVDLTERVVEEREAAVDREEAAIQEEEQRITERETAIQEEREQIAEEREAGTDAERQSELDDREQTLTQEEAGLEEDRTAAEERREELQEDRQEVAELTSQVREEREQIASDTRALLDEREISDEIRGLAGDLSPVYFIQVRDEGGTVLGQLVQINPVNGVLVNRSVENAIVSRSYTFLEDSLLVIAAQSDGGRLAVFDVTSLEEIMRGPEEIFLGSSLAVEGNPSAVYAVVKQEGEWYVGRFDADLQLIERSVIAVNPYTTLAFGGDKVWVQTKDDRIVALSLADMRIAP